MVKRLVRFGAIGLLNTVVDLTIYTLLIDAGLIFYIANLFSTSVAMSLSFTLNRKITFASSGNKAKQIVLFFMFTATGLWVIQPIVIHTVLSTLHISGTADTIHIIMPKLAAIVVSLGWNYFWYSVVVFKDDDVKKPQ